MEFPKKEADITFLIFDLVFEISKLDPNLCQVFCKACQDASIDYLT